MPVLRPCTTGIDAIALHVMPDKIRAETCETCGGTTVRRIFDVQRSMGGCRARDNREGVTVRLMNGYSLRDTLRHANSHLRRDDLLYEPAPPNRKNGADRGAIHYGKHLLGHRLSPPQWFPMGDRARRHVGLRGKL